jgi:hypothetical protein
LNICEYVLLFLPAFTQNIVQLFYPLLPAFTPIYNLPAFTQNFSAFFTRFWLTRFFRKCHTGRTTNATTAQRRSPTATTSPTSGTSSSSVRSARPLDYAQIRFRERPDDGSPSFNAAKVALREMERDARHARLATLPQSGVVARMMERKKHQ